jgi:DNA polymerase elongation subunit (family B)
MSAVYLNIETRPPKGSSPDPSKVEAPSNYKDPEKIKRYQEEHAYKEWAKLAVDPLQAEVFAFTYCLEEGEPKVARGVCEEELLRLLSEEMEEWYYEPYMVAGRRPMTIVTWNGEGFDCRLLRLRGMKYGLRELVDRTVCKRYGDSPAIDLMVPLTSRSQPFLGLDAMAEFLGIENKNRINGFEVWQCLERGREQEAYDHMTSRVTLLREIHRRMG